MIAGVLLAAGRGSRFGGDKLLAPLGGRPVARWSLDALAAAVDETIIVVGPGAPALEATLAGPGVRLVVHAGRDGGMGTSLAAGVRALPPGAEAVIIALADQPLVAPAVVASLVERWRGTRAPVVVPRYADGRGHPVLFDRCQFAALAALDGDRGARRVVDAVGERVEEVAVGGRVPVDVDTPEVLDQLRHGLRS